MLHFLRRCWEKVDSWLLMVGSQTGSLTPDPSFAHNLGCRCPNEQCKAILDIYASRAFHWYKERIKARRFDPSNRLLSFRESRRTPSVHFWEWELHSPTLPKVGLRHKHISSISADQGEAGTPQEEGGCHIKIASEINITVLLQVIIIALRPD